MLLELAIKDGTIQSIQHISDLESSELDMVVAGTKDAVLMVESEASELSEEVMLGAVMYAHEQFQVVIDSVAEFAKEVGSISSRMGCS